MAAPERIWQKVSHRPSQTIQVNRITPSGFEYLITVRNKNDLQGPGSAPCRPGAHIGHGIVIVGDDHGLSRPERHRSTDVRVGNTDDTLNIEGTAALDDLLP